MRRASSPSPQIPCTYDQNRDISLWKLCTVTSPTTRACAASRQDSRARLRAGERGRALLPECRDRFTDVARAEALLDVHELVAQRCVELRVQAAQQKPLGECL